MIRRGLPGSMLGLGLRGRLSDLRAFIDTNILVYAMETHPEFGGRAGEVLRMVDSGEVSGVVSSLVLLEMCWYLESRGRVDEMRNAVGVVEGSRVEVVDVAGRDVSRAAELKTVYKSVDLNDLVNYSVMRRLGLRDVFTNDSHFEQLPDIVPRFT